MLNLIISIVGFIAALVAGYGYIWSIIHGSTRPHPVTWGGWSLAGILGLWASFAGGAKIGLLVSAAFVVIVVITFVLSLMPKYGKAGAEKLDYVAGALAALAIIAWRIFHFSPAVAATIAILADVVFLWFTLRESWRQPDTEQLWPWVVGTFAEALGLVALGNYSYAAAAYPVYILFGNSLLVGVLLVKGPISLKKLLRRGLNKSM